MKRQRHTDQGASPLESRGDRKMNMRRHPAGIAALALLAGSCDLSVSNPGPVQDEFLNDPGAHEALVAGVSLNLSEGLNMIGFFGSEAAKEYTQGGRIHPTKLPVDPGQLTVDGIPNNAWNTSQQARWVAEDGVRRLEEALGEAFNSSPLGAKALLYAGYANRILGENMCEAVIDGGAPQPITTQLERADDFFTEALAVATAAGDAQVATAARAGRASVRLLLHDDPGATEDAGQVVDDFVFQAEFSIGSEGQYNFIYWVNANEPYRAHSVWNTFYDDYYTTTGDPRVSWGTDPEQPTAEFAWVPWHFQTKFAKRDAPINLSSGREMRLIEAEVLLRAGDWPRAMGIINDLRATVVSDIDGQPLAPWPATNLAEAWTALKRERGIELWLESRRLGDLRRWVAEDTPGEMEDVSDRIRLCFPIANSERQTNPNVGLDHADPVNPRYAGSSGS